MSEEKFIIGQEEIESHYRKLKKEAEDSGYRLNPDADFTKDLAKGLLTTTKRYGYPACPCRLASGQKAEDLDIICPCDYRDQDITEFNACYCALYVSDKASKGEVPIKPIPERRPPPGKRIIPKADAAFNALLSSKIPVWRCKVCGYLCAREDAPDICPICKAKKDRFERF
jgi:ferredoxin-thioredoxin reductase catalytic subunit/rubredoxin